MRQLRIVVCVWMGVMGMAASAQPVLSTRKILEGYLVYQDLKQKNVYYYAPGDLGLVRNSEGKPDFQLVQMRYTGSSAYGDAGEKRFRNLLQFTVAMPALTAEQALAIRKGLAPGGNVALRPLPIRRIVSSLVTPLGENAEKRFERIGSDGAFEAVSDASEGLKNAFWTQRTYTLKLNNHESQLLWEQIEKGQLALSLNYAFYADAVLGNNGDMHSSGLTAAQREGLPELPTDTAVQTLAIKGNALNIEIDPAKWPDLMRKIDINEDLPPGYAALEIRCYDLAENLRPDLFRKSVEIRATGVGGQPVNIRTEFSRTKPDLQSRSIKFPFAVKMTQPWQYRVEEIDLEGNRTVGEWVIQRSWTDLLDITTPEAQNAFVQRLIEVEFDAKAFEQAGWTSASVEIYYLYRGAELQAVATFDPNTPILPLSIRSDRDQPVRYRTVCVNATYGERKPGPVNVLTDTYLFVSPGN